VKLDRVRVRVDRVRVNGVGVDRVRVDRNCDSCNYFGLKIAKNLQKPIDAIKQKYKKLMKDVYLFLIK